MSPTERDDTLSASRRGRPRGATLFVPSRLDGSMALSLAAYVYASAGTVDHAFDAWFRFVLSLADSFTAAAIVPSAPFVG